MAAAAAPAAVARRLTGAARRLATPAGAHRPTLFLDVDDTLYDDGGRTQAALHASILAYCTEQLGVPRARAVELYRTHGTCLRGLRAEGIAHDAQHFLETTHAVPLAFGRDERLAELLRRLAARAACDVRVYTASTASHAQRCLEALGVAELLAVKHRPIIDVRAVGFAAKHSAEALAAARALAAGADGAPPPPGACILVDDAPANLRGAKLAGWRAVACGPAAHGLAEEVDASIASIHDLPRALPELF